MVLPHHASWGYKTLLLKFRYKPLENQIANGRVFFITSETNLITQY